MPSYRRSGGRLSTEAATDKLYAEIEALNTLPRPELVEGWTKIYGRPPPKYIKRGLVERAIAYDMQAKVFGGLKPATRKYLLDLGRQLSEGKGSVEPPVRFRPGSRLIREWNGKTHSVDVLDKGFAWNGKLYGSLSAIAREITGARWSGPRFFAP